MTDSTGPAIAANDGSAFEAQVTQVLKLLPRARLELHGRRTGKVADIILHVRETGRQRERQIAVECKDYRRALSRAMLVGIINDYRDALDRGVIDSLMIVTRNGVGANAAEVLDGSRVSHFRYTDLFGQVLDVAPLIHDMIEGMTLDGLDKYYEPPRCMDRDVVILGRYFDLAFNDFMDHAVSESYDFDTATEWASEVTTRYAGKPDAEAAKDWAGILNLSAGFNSRDVIYSAVLAARSRNNVGEWAERILRDSSRYTERIYNSIIEARTRNRPADLETMVLRWARDESHNHGLALLGSYGSGKSSFARHFAARCAEMHINGDFDRIPLLIELRNLKPEQDIAALITDELANGHGIESVSFTRFQYLNARGRFIMILDGFDEMKHGLSRESLIGSFEQLNKLSIGSSKVILCGRPTAFIDDDEQRHMLLNAGAHLENSATYIPVQLLAIAPKRVLPLVHRYAEAKGLHKDPTVAKRLAELTAEFERDRKLQELLSRPVHVPMFLRILPSFTGPLSALSRTRLYRTFIDATISREMLKRRSVSITFSREQRFDFASRLACEMLRAGDARTISIASIPASLIERFRPPRVALEVAKRELIGACFLERKPPDLLFFGHKSYCEFLVAAALRSVLLETHETDSLTLTPTREVASFLSDLLDLNDWLLALTKLSANQRVLDVFIKASFRGKQPDSDPDINTRAFENAILSNGVLTLYAKRYSTLPTRILGGIAEMGERMSDADKKALPSFLRLLLELTSHKEDIVAVHAFRALPSTLRPSEEDLVDRIGQERLRHWLELSWITF